VALAFPNGAANGTGLFVAPNSRPPAPHSDAGSATDKVDHVVSPRDTSLIRGETYVADRDLRKAPIRARARRRAARAGDNDRHA